MKSESQSLYIKARVENKKEPNDLIRGNEEERWQNTSRGIEIIKTN